MDIAIYSRISTDKQDNQNQLDQLRGFAATQGWRIKREYVDVATGKNSDREQFKALFKAASRREFELWFRQLDLAPFDLFIWPHPVGESPPAPRSERSPAAPEGRRV